MKNTYRQSLGKQGETLAAHFLEQQGYTVLERNYRTPYGEIDLIIHKGEGFVFVEVKTRASRSMGPPEISITTRKANHMRSAAECYMQEHPDLIQSWQIDVVSVQLHADGKPPIIDHFENAIQ